jgi:hypothetical protein
VAQLALSLPARHCKLLCDKGLGRRPSATGTCATWRKWITWWQSSNQAANRIGGVLGRNGKKLVRFGTKWEET